MKDAACEALLELPPAELLGGTDIEAALLEVELADELLDKADTEGVLLE